MYIVVYTYSTYLLPRATLSEERYSRKMHRPAPISTYLRTKIIQTLLA